MVVGTFRPYSPCPVYIVSRVNNSILNRLIHNYPIADLKLSPSDPSMLVTVSDLIRVWNIDSGHLVWVQSPHGDQVPDLCPFTAVSFAPSSPGIFAVVDVKGFCSVWDTAKKEAVEIYEIASEKLVGVSFVTDNVIGCVGDSGAVYVLDRTKHEAICSQGPQSIVPRCQPVRLAWLPHLSMVAVAYQVTGCVSVYDLSSCSTTPRLVGTTKSGESIADICWLKSNPEYLVVARDSGAIEVWSRNNLNAPHFDYCCDVGAASLCCANEGVLIGTIDGRVVCSPLPSNLSANPITAFSESPAISYPALAS